MEQNRQHGGNSFLLGVVVGVLLTLLFTTKKGRKIVAALTDEGLNRFSHLEKAITTMKEETAQSAKEYMDEEFDNEAMLTEQKNPQNGTQKKTHPAGRRFFRGVSKRS